MLSHLLSALSLARHAVALTLVASAAATTLVAGAVDQTGTQPQHETAPMTSPAPTTTPEPKTPDAWALMKECAGTRDLASDACRRFIDATGLGGDEVARLADGLASPRGEQQATADTKSPATAVTETMQACADLRSEMGGERSTEQLAALAEKINSVCPKAIRESKLSPGQFWSKVSAYR